MSDSHWFGTNLGIFPSKEEVEILLRPARDALERELRSLDWSNAMAVKEIGRRCQGLGSTIKDPREAAEVWFEHCQVRFHEDDCYDFENLESFYQSVFFLHFNAMTEKLDREPKTEYLTLRPLTEREVQEKLLPCPFCGGKAHLGGGEYSGYVYDVTCENWHTKMWPCNVKMEGYKTPTGAMLAWNRRERMSKGRGAQDEEGA